MVATQAHRAISDKADGQQVDDSLGMRAAIDEIKGGYEEIIDGWHRA